VSARGAPRVALVCAGVGYVNRGFERMTRDIFETLGDDVDVTLFKGAGASNAREIVLRVPRRTDPHARLLGVERALKLEYASFAARLLPRLRGDRFDVVHYLEPYLGNVLAAARRRLGLRFSLLLTDGLGLTRRSSSRADVVHVLTPLARDALIAEGRAAKEVVDVPAGTHTAPFRASPLQAEARRLLELPLDLKVILDVAAVNRRHKRIDVLVEEVARLGEEWMLVLDGSPEEPDVLDRAQARLGSRFRYLHVPSDQVPLLYAGADVFAHAALEEGFGIAAVEAMASGLPVLMHDAPHFAWLVGDPRQLVDFRSEGALERGIASLPPDAGERNRAYAAAFDWSALRPRYLALYESFAGRRGIMPYPQQPQS
jgi:glycosyltransferase involved in cell wall biosynthesis